MGKETQISLIKPLFSDPLTLGEVLGGRAEIQQY